MKVATRFIGIIFAAGILLTTARVTVAQTVSLTTVSANPQGPVFSVDGTNYTNPMSALWPQGSKHSLSTQPQQGTPEGVQYTSFKAGNGRAERFSEIRLS